MSKGENFEFAAPIRHKGQEAEARDELAKLEEGERGWKNLTPEEIEAGFQKRDISIREQEIIRGALVRAAEKLGEIGITEPEQLLPNENNVIIVDTPGEFPYATGMAGLSGIRIHMSKEQTLDDPKVQFRGAMFHELAHLFSRSTFAINDSKSGGDKVQRRMLGYDRLSFEDSGSSKGIYEEASTELFALFCLGPQETKTLIYPVQAVFVACLIEKLAQRTGTDSHQVFGNFLKGKIFHDKNFYKTMVDTFGTDFTRRLNNLESYWFSPTGESLIEILALAQEGGFSNQCGSLLAKLREGKVIEIPGIGGQAFVDIEAFQGETTDSLERVSQLFAAKKE